MHTAENKQNYSFSKYLRVESLRKASNLYCRSKIRVQGEEGGGIPMLRSPSGLQTVHSQLQETVPAGGRREGEGDLQKARED